MKEKSLYDKLGFDKGLLHQMENPKYVNADKKFTEKLIKSLDWLEYTILYLLCNDYKKEHQLFILPFVDYKTRGVDSHFMSDEYSFAAFIIDNSRPAVGSSSAAATNFYKIVNYESYNKYFEIFKNKFSLFKKINDKNVIKRHCIVNENGTLHAEYKKGSAKAGFIFTTIELIKVIEDVLATIDNIHDYTNRSFGTIINHYRTMENSISYVKNKIDEKKLLFRLLFLMFCRTKKSLKNKNNFKQKLTMTMHVLRNNTSSFVTTLANNKKFLRSPVAPAAAGAGAGFAGGGGAAAAPADTLFEFTNRLIRKKISNTGGFYIANTNKRKNTNNFPSSMQLKYNKNSGLLTVEKAIKIKNNNVNPDYRVTLCQIYDSATSIAIQNNTNVKFYFENGKPTDIPQSYLKFPYLYNYVTLQNHYVTLQNKTDKNILKKVSNKNNTNNATSVFLNFKYQELLSNELVYGNYKMNVYLRINLDPNVSIKPSESPPGHLTQYYSFSGKEDFKDFLKKIEVFAELVDTTTNKVKYGLHLLPKLEGEYRALGLTQITDDVFYHKDSKIIYKKTNISLSGPSANDINLLLKAIKTNVNDLFWIIKWSQDRSVLASLSLLITKYVAAPAAPAAAAPPAAPAPASKLYLFTIDHLFITCSQFDMFKRVYLPDYLENVNKLKKSAAVVGVLGKNTKILLEFRNLLVNLHKSVNLNAAPTATPMDTAGAVPSPAAAPPPPAKPAEEAGTSAMDIEGGEAGTSAPPAEGRTPMDTGDIYESDNENV